MDGESETPAQTLRDEAFDLAGKRLSLVTFFGAIKESDPPSGGSFCS
jgi:hypothetical protein